MLQLIWLLCDSLGQSSWETNQQSPPILECFISQHWDVLWLVCVHSSGGHSPWLAYMDSLKAICWLVFYRKAGIETARINQEHESIETSVLKETKTMLTIRRVMHQRGRGQDEGAKIHVCPEGSWSLYAWLRCACTYLGMPMCMCAHACKSMYPCVFAFGSICENGWGSVKYWNHYSKLQCFLTKVITLGNFQKPGCCCVDSWFG